MEAPRSDLLAPTHYLDARTTAIKWSAGVRARLRGVGIFSCTMGEQMPQATGAQTRLIYRRERVFFHVLPSAKASPVPQPNARRQAVMVVPVVITLSTKYAGKGCIGPAVRMMAC